MTFICRTKKETESVNKVLNDNFISAHFYHSEIGADQKDLVLKEWLSGNIQVVVATIAFGLGKQYLVYSLIQYSQLVLILIQSVFS